MIAINLKIKNAKEILGYEGLYSITRDGNVISHGGKSNHKKPIYLKPSLDKDGYRKCTLQKNKKKRYLRICRLVAIHFVKNPNGFPIVNHKDENKANDRYRNLEWTTNYGNWHHSFKDTEIKVIRVCKSTGKTMEFKSLMDASRASGVNQGNITNCLKGRCKSVGGFKWIIKKGEK